MTPTEFALLERKLRANKPARDRSKAKPTVDKIPGSVAGGFRAGKRKRGNSLLKQAPKEATRVVPFNIVDDASGLIVAANVRTVTYRRK